MFSRGQQLLTRPKTNTLGNVSEISLKKPPQTTSTERPKPTRGRTQAGQAWIVAVCDGRSGPHSEIGLAGIDLTTSEVFLGQFADSQSYAKTLHRIYGLGAAEILMPENSLEPSPTKLARILLEQLPDTEMVPIARRHFNDQAGIKFIRQYGLADEDGHIVVGLSSKYYALAACHALMNYVDNVRNVTFTPKSIKFRWKTLEGIMLIDAVSAKNLELVCNMVDPHSRHTLFGVLDKTCTPMGGRLLKMNLLQPLTDLTTIETRLDALEELSVNEERFSVLQSSLKQLLDVDHIVTHLIQIPKKASLKHSEQAINRIIMLRDTLQRLKPVRLAILACKNPVLRTIATALSDTRLAIIEQELNTWINPDVAYVKTPLALRHQRCYAVKSGSNGLLDAARQTYREICDEAYRLVDEYTNRFGIQIKIAHNQKIGFYMECDVNGLEGGVDALPVNFINVHVKNKSVSFTSLDLMKYNDRINEAVNEIYLMSDKTINDLHAMVRQHIASLYRVAEACALLDMLSSFVVYNNSTSTCRPSFSENLMIKAGRHPIREVIYADKFTPNDVYASHANNFQIITGINMSGKSTYLRQIALLHVMAHVGCHVPCQYAQFRLTPQLFTHLRRDEDEGQSSWMTEMTTMAYILDHVTDQGLILLDELGHSTNHEEGLNVVYGICETLVEIKAFTFFATHWHDLTTMLTCYPNVVNIHLESIQDEQGYHHTYAVKDGKQEDGHYGLWMARQVGFPEDVLQRAFEISEQLKQVKQHKVKQHDAYVKQRLKDQESIE